MKSAKPRATNPELQYGKVFKDDIRNETKAQFQAQGVDKPPKAEYLNAFNAKRKEKYEESSSKTQEEMKTAANEKNEQIAVGPPPEHIAE